MLRVDIFFFLMQTHNLPEKFKNMVRYMYRQDRFTFNVKIYDTKFTRQTVLHVNFNKNTLF